MWLSPESTEAIAVWIECLRSFSCGSESEMVLPRSTEPAVVIAPPADSRASNRVVLPAPA